MLSILNILYMLVTRHLLVQKYRKFWGGHSQIVNSNRGEKINYSEPEIPYKAGLINDDFRKLPISFICLKDPFSDFHLKYQILSFIYHLLTPASNFNHSCMTGSLNWGLCEFYEKSLYWSSPFQNGKRYLQVPVLANKKIICKYPNCQIKSYLQVPLSLCIT